MQEWEIHSWRALIRWRDFDGKLHMIRQWAGSRTRAAEAARGAAAAAVEKAAAVRDEQWDGATGDGDLVATVADLTDRVMTHHVPSLSARTQEEYARVRTHMDDERLPPLVGELPRAVDAGMARAWLETYVTLHGPSSATRAKALLAKALDRATESKRMRTPVNPIRAVPGGSIAKHAAGRQS